MVFDRCWCWMGSLVGGRFMLLGCLLGMLLPVEVGGICIVVGLYAKKKPLAFAKGFNKYGSYLLSRISLQYHRPWEA